MIENPRLSVCVPMFNKQSAVEHSLRTILANNVDGMEVLIFDNGSTDGSSEIARRLAAEDPRIRYVRHEHTVMVQESWRMAFLYGRGELLKLHSADDELHPDFLSQMLAPFEKSPELEFTLCAEQVETFDVPQFNTKAQADFYDVINANCRNIVAMTDPRQRARQLVASAGAFNYVGNIYKVIVRRSCLPLDRWTMITRAYPMPTSYPDWDFLMRLLLNHRGFFVDRILSLYRIDQDAPIIRLEHNPAMKVADAFQLMLQVMTTLADPTLRSLREVLAPAEIQQLHQEAVKRLTKVVQEALDIKP